MNDRINGVPFLEGQPNFRGLEWIKKTDGKRFRKNMVYRSGRSAQSKWQRYSETGKDRLVCGN